MSLPFRVACIGIDHPHGAGWRELVGHVGEPIEVSAIVPAFGGTVASLEERYAAVPRYLSVDELIDRGEFDGAIICLPNRESPAAVEALAHAGKHILIEKPGASSAADFEPVARAIQAAGVGFQTGMMWRYDTGAERLKAMVSDGRFGKLISIEMGHFTSDVARRGPDHYLFDPRQSGRGFFNWLGCHWIDLVPYLTGERVIAVTARVGCFGATSIALDDGGTAILESAAGTLVTLTGGYWLPRWTGELNIALRGSERWVHWEPGHPGTAGRLRIHGPQPQFHAMEETFDIPADLTPGYGGAKGTATLRDWLLMARGERSGCRNTVDSTREMLGVLDAVYRSSEEGRRVEIGVE